MKILIAEDDPVTSCRLEHVLTDWGHEVTAVGDGIAANRLLQPSDGPPLAILDWMIPGVDGLEVCRRIRAARPVNPPYMILLTAKSGKSERAAGLREGADDYITKPYDDEELQAHLSAAQRVVQLRQQLVKQVIELQDALAHVKALRGLLPICVYCKKIRNDKDYWQQVEAYIAQHSEAEFSHTICPNCYKEKVEPELERFTGRAMDDHTV